MKRLSTAQIEAMNRHLEGDHSTLRVAFVGGHRETLISFEVPKSDGLIVGENYAGNRVDFHSADVASITYVQVDERVMADDELRAHKQASPLDPDGPIKVRRRRR